MMNQNLYLIRIRFLLIFAFQIPLHPISITNLPLTTMIIIDSCMEKKSIEKQVTRSVERSQSKHQTLSSLTTLSCVIFNWSPHIHKLIPLIFHNMMLERDFNLIFLFDLVFSIFHELNREQYKRSILTNKEFNSICVSLRQ